MTVEMAEYAGGWEVALPDERARLVRLCVHLTGDWDAAEDLAQETLVEAWRQAHKLYDPAGRARWLAAIARNMCLRWGRRQGRELARRAYPASDEAGAAPGYDDWPADEVDVETELERDELARLLDRALALLPPVTRQVLIESYVEESPQAEVAARLGLSESAVAMQLQRGKQLYYVGEILDRERLNGTLVGLFLAPRPRFSWLSGFTLVGLVETVLIAAVALVFGHVAYGVRYDPDLVAVAVSLALFLAALWGLGFVFAAIGLLIKKANQLSNLIYPFAILLGGVYYPVAALPAWLRYPAHALPLGYGIQALAGATLYHKGIGELASQLLPLAGFALILPVAGALAFRLLERLVRARGELDLY